MRPAPLAGGTGHGRALRRSCRRPRFRSCAAFPCCSSPPVLPTSHGPSFSFSVPGNCINRENTSEPSLTNVDIRHDDLVDLVGKSLSIEEFVDRITFMGAGPEGVQGDVMMFD